LGGLFYLLMMMAGFLGDHDHDLDVDHGVDLGHDVDVGHDAHFDHDADHDVDAADQDASWIIQVLSFLGLGKIPISILIMCSCFIWGLSGWISNQTIQWVGLDPAYLAWLSVLVALFVTSFLTRGFALALAKIMPTTETYGVSDRMLFGRKAKALFDITPTFGIARLYDEHGTLHDVACRVGKDEEVIPRGTNVILAVFSPEKNAFFVRRDPLEEHELQKN
jgi:hypothetical protein